MLVTKAVRRWERVGMGVMSEKPKDQASCRKKFDGGAGCFAYIMTLIYRDYVCNRFKMGIKGSQGGKKTERYDCQAHSL